MATSLLQERVVLHAPSPQWLLVLEAVSVMAATLEEVKALRQMLLVHLHLHLHLHLLLPVVVLFLETTL